MRPSFADSRLLVFACALSACGDKPDDTAGAGTGTGAGTAGGDDGGPGEDDGTGDDGGTGDGTGTGDDGGTGGGDDGTGTGDDGAEPVDADADGVSVEDGDCDDSDATVHPGARDRCANGVDEDCDGTVDVPDCDGWATCYADCLSDLGPAAWWRLGEAAGATTATDATGGGLDGTYNGLAAVALGTPGALSGDPDTALDLSGHSDWVEFGDVRDLGAGNLSISLWLKTSSTRGYVLGKSDPRMTDGRFGIGLSGARTTTANPAGAAFFLDAGSPPDTFYESVATVADGDWHNVVFTLDRFGDASLYIDGALDGTWSTAGYAGASFDTDNALVLGLLHAEYATTSDPTDGHPFTGAVDEVAFFDRLLTADEVALLHGLAQ